MKKFLTFLTILTFSIASAASVNGYFKKNGTYVMPHTRSAPNNTVMDNSSFKGNINLSTGKVGTNTYKHSKSSSYYQGYWDDE